MRDCFGRDRKTQGCMPSQAGSVRELYLQKERWHALAGKQRRRCGATRSFENVNVVVSASDERSIEVLASGLPFHHGAQLAIDVTLRSALTSCGGGILELPGRKAPLSRGLAQTKSASTRNCWRATGATWLLLPWRRVADGALKLWSSWNLWRLRGHGRLHQTVDLQGTDGPVPDLFDLFS